MRVFRIVREKYLESALSGRGALLSNGFRWNSLGTALVYTAASRSLAVLEIAVHLDLSEDLPKDRFLVEIDIPDGLEVFDIDLADLPLGWDAKPPETVTQQYGDNFVLSNSSAVLRVPSSIIPEEYNILLNPNHPEFSKIRVVDAKAFQIDSRLGQVAV